MSAIRFSCHDISNYLEFFLLFLVGKSGNLLDNEANIKLIHQQPRLEGSGTIAEMSSPLLMRHQRSLRDSRRSAHLVRCNSSSSHQQQQHLVASSRCETLIRHQRRMSQSAQYLAPSAERQQTSLTNCLIGREDGSGYHLSSDNIDIGHPQMPPPPRPQVELTLVYVSSSGQLLVHIHRLSSAPVVRYGKESATYVKVRQHAAPILPLHLVYIVAYYCILLQQQSRNQIVSSLHSACASAPAAIRAISWKTQRPRDFHPFLLFFLLFFFFSSLSLSLIFSFW